MWRGVGPPDGPQQRSGREPILRERRRLDDPVSFGGGAGNGVGHTEQQPWPQEAADRIAQIFAGASAARAVDPAREQQAVDEIEALDGDRRDDEIDGRPRRAGRQAGIAEGMDRHDE